MHISRLELDGFKSFPRRQSLEFGAGISGVIGPNGCGKSNIIDAIKWCLGETSSRSLRVNTMRDLIFAGAQGYAPVGRAEVTIVFDAGDEPFPNDYQAFAQVALTRRMFRDGKTEYLINKQPVLRRDIRAFCLSANLSNKLNFCIEQGQIEQIVLAQPEERRSIIEDVSGIAKFKSDLRETQQKLDQTRPKLERVLETVNLKQAQLKKLVQQSRHAVRHRVLRALVKRGEIALSLAQSRSLETSRLSLGTQLEKARTEEASLLSQIEQQEQELEQARQAALKLEEVVGELRDHLSEVEANRREQDSARQYLQREKQNLEGWIARQTGQAQSNRQQREGAVERVALTQTECKGAQAELVESDKHLEALRARQALSREDIESRSALIREVQDNVRQGRQGLTRDTLKLEQSIEQHERLGARREEVDRRCALATALLDDLGRERSEAEEKAQTLAARLAELEPRLAAAEAAVTTNIRTLDEARQAVSRAAQAWRVGEQALTRQRARLESLEALQRGHAGLEDHVRSALEVAGVLGTLADQIDVPEALEKPLSTALGDGLSYVLVPDEDTATRLSQEVEGQVGILIYGDAEPASKGLARDIGGSDAGRRALGILLPATRRWESLDEARLAREARGCIQLVDAADEALPVVVTASGAVLVGERGEAGRAILARRREIAELQTSVERDTANVASLLAALDAARARVSENEDALQHARTALSQARQQLEQARLSHQATVRKEQEISRQLRVQDGQSRSFQKERASIVRDMERLATERTTLEERLQTGQDAHAALETMLAARQAEIAEARGTHESLQRELSTRQSARAQLAERILGFQRAEADLRKQVAEAERRIAETEQEIANGRERLGSVGAEAQSVAQSLAELAKQQATLRKQFESQRMAFGKERAALKQRTKRLEASRKSRESATARRTSHEQALERATGELARIQHQIEERYAIQLRDLFKLLQEQGRLALKVDPDTLAENLPDTVSPSKALRARLVDLELTPETLSEEEQVLAWVKALKSDRAALSRLGAVNLLALEQYQEERAELDQLERERKDVEEAVASLEKAITSLNRKASELFSRTFKLVNQYFGELYPRLVGGGTAELKLTDETSLLTSGVEILVCPPNKRLRNLRLLSGGEKAQVAISLLFALFRVQPSPFCLLDEVDAPLDEGNGARFNSMLREMSSVAQFIVITHNPKTMTMVDTLYMVRGQGVSEQVLTMRGSEIRGE